MDKTRSGIGTSVHTATRDREVVSRASNRIVVDEIISNQDVPRSEERQRYPTRVRSRPVRYGFEEA